MLIDTFIAELAVERLNEYILRRFARLNQFQRRAIGIRLLVDRPARQSWPRVRSQRFEIARKRAAPPNARATLRDSRPSYTHRMAQLSPMPGQSVMALAGPIPARLRDS